MLIDEKGRLFGKINVVDFIVIAVIVLAVAGVGYKLLSSSSMLFKKAEMFEIVFYNEDLMQQVADSINIGDKVKDSVKNAVFGEVTKKEVDKSIVFASNDKGELVQTTRPGYVSMKLYVHAKGVHTDTGYIFNNADYYVGRSLELRAGIGVIWTRIVDIRKVEEE
jgi:hypothetical protein